MSRNGGDRCWKKVVGSGPDFESSTVKRFPPNETIFKQQLVGGAITILKNMSSSMGRMTSHI